MPISCEREVTVRGKSGDLWAIDDDSCLFIHPIKEAPGVSMELFDRNGNMTVSFNAYDNGDSSVCGHHERFPCVILVVSYQSRYFAQAAVEERIVKDNKEYLAGFRIDSVGEVTSFVMDVAEAQEIEGGSIVRFEGGPWAPEHEMFYSQTGTPLLYLKQAGVPYYIGMDRRALVDVNFHPAGAEAFQVAKILSSPDMDERSVGQLHECLMTMGDFMFRAPHVIFQE